MFRTLKSRLAKLESRRSQQGPNRVLHYDPRQPNSKAEALKKCGQGKFLLVAQYGSMQEWEAALERQQENLIAEAAPQTIN